MPESTNTRERLAAIVATADAATAGPWHVHEIEHVFVGNGSPGALQHIVHASGDRPADMVPDAAHRLRADAAFITDARTTVPALVAAVTDLLDLADRMDGWAAENEPLAASGSWQADGYAKAYRNGAAEIRRIAAAHLGTTAS